MLSGVATQRTGSLRMRRSAAGITVEQPIPEQHVFPRKFLDRELNRMVRVTIAVQSDPPVRYEVVEFADRDLVGSLLPVEVAVEEAVRVPKRRWWQRRGRRDDG